MATQPNDFIRLCFEGGQFKDLLIKKSGMQWPPPMLVSYGGIIYRRKRMSELTDEAAAHPNVARGAEYHVAPIADQMPSEAVKATIPELIVLPTTTT